MVLRGFRAAHDTRVRRAFIDTTRMCEGENATSSRARFAVRLRWVAPKNNGNDQNDTEGYRKQKITARAIVEMRYTKGKMKENARRCVGGEEGGRVGRRGCR